MSNVTFIVGAPGAGKTALLLDMLLREVVPQGRPIYVDERADIRTGVVGPSIPALNIPHQLIPDAKRWHEPGVLPDGACLVLDEVQDIWPAVSSGTKLTPELLAMNRIRHRGITIYCTSQVPNMVHSHVRGLVGRYVLLRNLGLLGRRLYEWTEFPERPLAYKTAPQQKPYKLPKRVFELYRSASLHVKHKTTIPRAVLVAGFAFLSLGVLAWFAWRSISGKVDGAKNKALAPAAAASAGLGASGAQNAPGAPIRPPGAPRLRVLEVGPAVRNREPYAGLGLHLAGSWEQDGKMRATFTASVDGRAVSTVRDLDLMKAGYSWRLLGPCAALLIFGDRERAVTCDTPAAGRPAAPAGAASSAV